MIVFFIALFIMLTAAITTELIRSKRHKKSIVNYSIFLNALVFLGAIALFIRDHNPLYMLFGMFFSAGLLALTYYKYTDFN